MASAPLNTPLPAAEKPGWMAIALIAAFVLAAVVMFAVGMRLVKRSPGPDVFTIAVIPFTAADPAPGDPSFRALFTRQMADAVSKAPGLRLVEPSQAVTLIEGTVQTSGRRVRVAVWLVRASDRRALWTQRYEFQAKDAAGVQAEILRGVASTLRLPGATAPE